MSESKHTPGPFETWIDQYAEIRATRDEADANGDDDLMMEYDLAYTEHLENLHAMMDRKTARRCDAAPDLLAAAEQVANVTLDGEMREGEDEPYEMDLLDSFDTLVSLVRMARKALADA